jgi:transcriptional regulator with XRE-family HTH domain
MSAMYPPGLRLRKIRESQGLTYRDVEKASYEIAVKRGRPDFVLHISRLADIENRNVVPSLHKLYSLAAILHLDAMEISSWYEAPFNQTLRDAGCFPPSRTYLGEAFPAASASTATSQRFELQTTDLLRNQSPAVSAWPRVQDSPAGRFRNGYIGLSDRRMMPLLRPGSTVLIDTSLRRIEDADWSSEYDRPLYFVEIRDGYRCGWFQKDRATLIMQPHTLSRCAPETWRTPDEAEVVGQVVGVVTYLNEPWSFYREAAPEARADWKNKAQ